MTNRELVDLAETVEILNTKMGVQYDLYEPESIYKLHIKEHCVNKSNLYSLQKITYYPKVSHYIPKLKNYCCKPNPKIWLCCQTG